MIERRDAFESDKPFIKALFRLVYEEVVTRQIGHWDAELYDKYLEDTWPQSRYQILETGGQPIGVIWLSEEGDHIWLREIQIVPEHQGKGIGSKLIAEFISHASALGKPLRLRVLKSSRAKSLYERMGFQVTGNHNDTHYWMEHRSTTR
jgi:GNAT superfamily N-acetyltransferase